MIVCVRRFFAPFSVGPTARVRHFYWQFIIRDWPFFLYNSFDRSGKVGSRLRNHSCGLVRNKKSLFFYFRSTPMKWSSTKQTQPDDLEAKRRLEDKLAAKCWFLPVAWPPLRWCVGTRKSFEICLGSKDQNRFTEDWSDAGNDLVFVFNATANKI